MPLIAFSINTTRTGDPATIIVERTLQGQLVRQQLGLNEPFLVRLLHWYGSLLRAIGQSIRSSATINAIIEHSQRALS